MSGQKQALPKMKQEHRANWICLIILMYVEHRKDPRKSL